MSATEALKIVYCRSLCSDEMLRLSRPETTYCVTPRFEPIPPVAYGMNQLPQAIGPKQTQQASAKFLKIVTKKSRPTSISKDSESISANGASSRDCKHARQSMLTRPWARLMLAVCTTIEPIHANNSADRRQELLLIDAIQRQILRCAQHAAAHILSVLRSEGFVEDYLHQNDPDSRT